MLITKEVNIKWNGNNKKYYVSKGYTFTLHGDTFTVKIDDVTKGSEVMVDVKCDYCGDVYTKTYYKYNLHRKNTIIQNDCCKNCKQTKVKETINIKYGVDNIMELENIKEKRDNTMLNLYGVKSYAQTDISRVQFTGENNPRWKGGITSKYMKSRNSIDQKNWKLNVFKRDDFQCVRCGCNKSGSFNAHHVLNFAEYENLINDIDNGITLCKKCHKEFHLEYGYTKNNQTQINEFLNYNQDVETIETTA